jgi:hypothetical protein
MEPTIKDNQAERDAKLDADRKERIERAHNKLNIQLGHILVNDQLGRNLKFKGFIREYDAKMKERVDAYRRAFEEITMVVEGKLIATKQLLRKEEANCSLHRIRIKLQLKQILAQDQIIRFQNEQLERACSQQDQAAHLRALRAEVSVLRTMKFWQSDEWDKEIASKESLVAQISRLHALDVHVKEAELREKRCELTANSFEFEGLLLKQKYGLETRLLEKDVELREQKSKFETRLLEKDVELREQKSKFETRLLEKDVELREQKSKLDDQLREKDVELREQKIKFESLLLEKDVELREQKSKVDDQLREKDVELREQKYEFETQHAELLEKLEARKNKLRTYGQQSKKKLPTKHLNETIALPKPHQVVVKKLKKKPFVKLRTTPKPPKTTF